uniref:Uncharacterized protein B23B10.210 n=1 Tax=Neurospora crassa TaxID=5141 RepID=Q872X7_NEUCS|nr:hypothetical protein [Neurospora crassa]
MEDEEADYENEKEKMDEQQVETRIDGKGKKQHRSKKKKSRMEDNREEGQKGTEKAMKTPLCFSEIGIE